MAKKVQKLTLVLSVAENKTLDRSNYDTVGLQAIWTQNEILLSVINTATVTQEMKKTRQIDEDQRSLWAESMFVYCNP